MYKDSSAFIGWASTCTVERGYINIADTTLVYSGSSMTTYGNNLRATGPADEMVVSLGDHGSALLEFDLPIVDRSGPDFAVFENSFNDAFLELGFVEVSSDCQRFVRFPAVTHTPVGRQISTFDTIDATKIYNLAGKYRHGYGTPFDLDDIKDSLGIDLNNITCVRIIDVTGCIQEPFATTDSQGNKVNDPWPTPFDTGGFDLDAVGIIHSSAQAINEDKQLSAVRIVPNPVADWVTIVSAQTDQLAMKITDPVGRVLLHGLVEGNAKFDLSSFHPGMYILSITMKNGQSLSKKIIKN